MEKLTKLLGESLNPNAGIRWKSEKTQGLSLGAGTGGEELHEWFESILRYERKPILFDFRSDHFNLDTRIFVGPIKKHGPNADWIPFTTEDQRQTVKLLKNNTVKRGTKSSVSDAINSHRPEIVTGEIVANPRPQKITKTWYFRTSILFMLLPVIAATALITISEPMIFEFSKSGLEHFFGVFSIPFKLLATLVLVMGAIFAFHRLVLMHDQSERQIRNQEEVSYQQFRSEFLSAFDQSGYTFKTLKISPTIIFSYLYPRSTGGIIKLSDSFDEFISDDHEQDFINVMRHISENSGSQKPERFWSNTYMGAYFLFAQLKNICPIDADVNFSYMAGDASFRGDFARHVEGTLNDILHIVTVVNMLQGGTYFSNNERRIWRKYIDQIPATVATVTKISEILEECGWWHAYVRNDTDAIEEIALRGLLQQHQNIGCDAEGARKYIFEMCATSITTPNEEMLINAAEKLGVDYIAPPRFQEPDTATPDRN